MPPSSRIPCPKRLNIYQQTMRLRQKCGKITNPVKRVAVPLIYHHRPDALTGVHQVESLVDVRQVQRADDENNSIYPITHKPYDGAEIFPSSSLGHSIKRYGRAKLRQMSLSGPELPAKICLFPLQTEPPGLLYPDTG